MSLPKKRGKSKICCGVPGCGSSAFKHEDIHFFHLPPSNTSFVMQINEDGEKELVDRRIVWIELLKLEREKVSEFIRVCSLHFSEDNFIPTYKSKVRTHLKKTSVPSRYLPDSSTMVALKKMTSDEHDDGVTYSSEDLTDLLERSEDSQDNELTCVEDSLMSLEKIDRASPDLWPEQIPGVNEFIAQNLTANDQSPWLTGLTADDINQLHQLGNLSVTGLIAEVKKLHDRAYQLGLEEAKEMTRGKYLNIFKNK